MCIPNGAIILISTTDATETRLPSANGIKFTWIWCKRLFFLRSGSEGADHKEEFRLWLLDWKAHKYLLISYGIWYDWSWSFVGLWQFLRLFLRKMYRVIPGGSLRDEFRFLKFELHGFAISCIWGRPENKKRPTSQTTWDKKGRAVVSQMGRCRSI